jgi:CHAT domain-containing protein/tetratricopeptide (TPR) repeat protein
MTIRRSILSVVKLVGGLVLLFGALAPISAKAVSSTGYEACTKKPLNPATARDTGQGLPPEHRAPSAQELILIQSELREGQDLKRSGNYEQAWKHFDAAGEIVRVTYGAESSLYGVILFNIAGIYDNLYPKRSLYGEQNFNSKAYTTADDAADILYKTLGPCSEWTSYAVALRSLLAYKNDGIFYDATSDMREALSSLSIIFGMDSEEYSSAVAIAHRLADLHAESSGDSLGRRADAAGRFLMELGYCQDADQYFTWAISRLYGRKPGWLDVRYLIDKVHVGRCLGEPRIDAALSAFSILAQAHTSERQGDDSSDSELSTATKLAQTLISAGYIDDAEKVVDWGIPLVGLSSPSDLRGFLAQTLLLANSSPDLRNFIGVRASIAHVRGQEGDALALTGVRLALVNQALGHHASCNALREDTDIATLCIEKAAALADASASLAGLGKWTAAIENAREAREIAAIQLTTELGGIERYNLAFVRTVAYSGGVIDRDNLKEAELVLNNSCSLISNYNNIVSSNTAECYQYRSQLFFVAGDFAQSAKWARAALNALFPLFQGETHSSTGLRDRQSLSATASQTEQAADLFIKTSALTGVGVNEPFLAAQVAGSSAVSSAFQRNAAIRIAEQDGVGAEARERESLLDSSRILIGQIDEAGSSTDSGQRVGAAYAQYSANTVRLKNLDRTLQGRSRRYWDLIAPEPLPISELQARARDTCATGLLRCDEALIDVLQTEAGAYVFVVTREGSAWSKAGMDGAELNAAVARLRSCLDFATCTGADKRFHRKTAYDLYMALFGDEKVAALIASKPKLLVVANGALSSLPLGVLVTKAPQEPDTFEAFAHDTAWLAIAKTITVLPSVSSLKTLRILLQHGASDPTVPFIGFAPKFSGKPALRGASPTSYFRGGQGDLERVRELPALSNEDEINTMQMRLGGMRVIGPDASEAKVYALDAGGQGPLAKARVITFSTHGLISGEFKFLAEPALAFTPPSEPPADHPQSNDGLLTASEIAGLRLNADWVVLSACNTGSGATPEAEGLSGLARAFFYAGARTLLVSHWHVDDEPTTFLTTRTIELSNDGRHSRAQALQQAQQEMIGGTASIPAYNRLPNLLANPALWAPLSIVGE